MTNFPPNDKKWQTKWQFCRLQKLHFSRSIVILWSFFSHFSIKFRYFSIFWRKLRHNDKKWQIFHQMTKNDKQHDNFARCKNCISLEALPFFCHFSVILQSMFDIFAYFWENCTKTTKKWRIFHQMTKNDKQNDNFAGCKNCIFLEALSFCGHFSLIFQSSFDIFPYFGENCTTTTKNDKFSTKWLKHDKPKLKWQEKTTKNDKRNDRQNWHDKKMTKKMQNNKTNDQKMTNKMTDKIEMTKKMATKTTKNDKINIWTISRVWLRVSSKTDEISIWLSIAKWEWVTWISDRFPLQSQHYNCSYKRSYRHYSNRSGYPLVNIQKTMKHQHVIAG